MCEYGECYEAVLGCARENQFRMRVPGMARTHTEIGRSAMRMARRGYPTGEQTRGGRGERQRDFAREGESK